MSTVGPVETALYRDHNVCVLAGLNAAEIAGIVVGVCLSLLAIVLMVIVLMTVLNMGPSRKFKGRYRNMLFLKDKFAIQSLPFL